MDRQFAAGTVNAAVAGEGPPLFLFHSLLSDRASFDAIVPELSKSFRVIVPELPGFGRSQAVTGGLAASKSDARRLIEGKGVTLSGLPITNPDQKLYLGDFVDGHALVRKGKQSVLVLVLK